MSDDDNSKFNQDTGKTPTVSHVSVKPPPFNRDDPEIWFFQLEAQFSIANISVDSTMYSHLLSALDPDTVKQVRDKIINPTKTNKYVELKKAIIDRRAESARSKLDQLLSGLQLGDKKPTQLLREMRNLAGDQMKDNVLQEIWLKRLPHGTQKILVSLETDLEHMAMAADNIYDVDKPLGVSSVTSHGDSELAAQVDALTKKFDRFLQSRSRSRSRYRYPNRQESRSRNSNDDQVCYYHDRYRHKARKCKPFCKFYDNFKASNDAKN